MGTLTDHERTRYSRQILMEGWGTEGQINLKSSSVFIAGAGGLGSPVSIYLAVAGEGEIRISDADTVELSNLNRQTLHTDARIGERKVVSAVKMLHELNPTVKIVPCSDYLDKASVERIVARPDVVIDCLDNSETRYLLNDYCVKQGIPFVHGAVHGLMGQVSFLHPPETPCLRCLFLDAPPKETFPIVGATAGIVGSIQAMEALKFLTGVGSVLKGQLLFIDGADMTVTTIDVKRAPSCPVCGSCV